MSSSTYGGRPTAKLSCEALEARENPAGNVTATLLGGTLIVNGDVFDNQFSIQQNSLGDLFIFGLNGTLINGVSTLFVGRGLLTNLFVNTWFGNDSVHIAGIGAFGSMFVSLGDENDALLMVNSGATFLAIDAQGGNDAVGLFGVVGFNAVDVTGGTGIDVLQNRGIFGGLSRIVRDFEIFI
jgi:hypothetical protein